MKKGIQNFCSNTTSTSTLLQSSNRGAAGQLMTKPPTLEEMIIQLELEEEEDQDVPLPRRMSCVDGVDIMKSARNALNQYPRFSLDGRDAMYRSSFKNFVDGRKSFCGSGGAPRLPSTVAGERVMWCKPGVVAALMGLDAVPVPVGRGFASRKQSLRRMGKMELEKERLSVNLKNRRGVRREDLGMSLPAFEKVPLSSQGSQADWRFKRAR
ncbi:hypothetical protein KSP39_PZI018689 [Platanthera zijinensis]|uniref:DUF3741 domain-containing protein n=1 Tax=Platanthera zijinensis TaxID=2320716 RepID=A0AAP0B4L0_9ASPA